MDDLLSCEERMQIGTGDGAITGFSHTLHGPIVPGSVLVRVLHQDTVSRLGSLADEFTEFNFELAVHDIARDGCLHGHTSGGSTVGYETGHISITWQHAPATGAPIVCCWRRELSRLRGSKVQVQLPSGRTEWVSFSELSKALTLE